jgi:glutamate racemase
VIVALIDSGLGLLPTAFWLRKLRPELDLMLMTDSDGSPWGGKSQDWVSRRVVETAQDAVSRGAEAVVLACNTAGVTALDLVRAELGDGVPVVGTVPAIKPAAEQCERFAIWATAATTASSYQADLVERFAAGSQVTPVACHGLADAIDQGDSAAIRTTISEAARRTPADIQGVVLGCTHYPLVADAIVATLPAGVRLFDSAAAVATQTIRRVDALDRNTGGPQPGTTTVISSGNPGELPPAAALYTPPTLSPGGRFVVSNPVRSSYMH